MAWFIQKDLVVGEEGQMRRKIENWVVVSAAASRAVICAAPCIG